MQTVLRLTIVYDGLIGYFSPVQHIMASTTTAWSVLINRQQNMLPSLPVMDDPLDLEALLPSVVVFQHHDGRGGRGRLLLINHDESADGLGQWTAIHFLLLDAPRLVETGLQVVLMRPTMQ